MEATALQLIELAKKMSGKLPTEAIRLYITLCSPKTLPVFDRLVRQAGSKTEVGAILQLMLLAFQAGQLSQAGSNSKLVD
jgi:hypothetical protein